MRRQDHVLVHELTNAGKTGPGMLSNNATVQTSPDRAKRDLLWTLAIQVLVATPPAALKATSGHVSAAWSSASKLALAAALSLFPPPEAIARNQAAHPPGFLSATSRISLGLEGGATGAWGNLTA